MESLLQHTCLAVRRLARLRARASLLTKLLVTRLECIALLLENVAPGLTEHVDLVLHSLCALAREGKRLLQPGKLQLQRAALLLALLERHSSR